MKISTARSALSIAALTLTLPLAALTPGGDEAGKIRFADRIDHWQVIDAHKMVLAVAESARYLVTFRAPCHGLRFAFNVGISSSNNTVYAGFDAVIADGMSCPIATIDRIAADPPQAQRNPAG